MSPSNAWKDGLPLFPSHLPWFPKVAIQVEWDFKRRGLRGRSLGLGSERILFGDACCLSQAPGVMWYHPPSATPLTRSNPCAYLYLTSDFELGEW